ncbi:MAG: hypothetical protein A3F17_01640 [Gammaproteobacteria bacterium RIFCSPHIGHO2_12_FULL_41_15]|nr:MAG: hypothetical protein A3F17_01640 [Gammaproteobacteria bacterium RIFCSPHIGHO2_12_FULL_41_15]
MLLTQIAGIDGSPINDSHESPLVTTLGITFQCIIMAISIWLPLQGYLELHGYIPTLVQVVTTWVFWGMMFIFTLMMIALIKRRWRYVGSNWLNFLNILVAYPAFWIVGGRYPSSLVWAMIVIVLMLTPWLVMVIKILSAQKIFGIVIAFVVYTIQGGFILAFVDSAIGNPWSGIWWAFQTITTVGYGDIVPETYLGQVYGIIFMLGGISLMAILSATITYMLLQKNHVEEKKRAIKLLQDFQGVTAELHEIKRDLKELMRRKDNE